MSKNPITESLITLGAILAFAGFCVYLLSCYKGDPGYGNTDYPPITETHAKDSGVDAAKGK